MTELLETINLQTHDTCEWSVIWMHGLGADGSDFVPVIPELGLDPAVGIRFVFPNAPAIPVTCNGGCVMPAWYDIISLGKNSRDVDAAGILHSRQQIRDLIEQEKELGIPSGRIFLAGSQFQLRYESERSVLTCEFHIKTDGACGACGQRGARWESRGFCGFSTASDPVRWRLFASELSTRSTGRFGGEFFGGELYAALRDRWLMERNSFCRA